MLYLQATGVALGVLLCVPLMLLNDMRAVQSELPFWGEQLIVAAPSLAQVLLGIGAGLVIERYCHGDVGVFVQVLGFMSAVCALVLGIMDRCFRWLPIGPSVEESAVPVHSYI